MRLDYSRRPYSFLALRIDKRIYVRHTRDMTKTEITKAADILGQNVIAWNPGCNEVTGTVVDGDAHTVHVAWSLNGKSYVGRFTNHKAA